MEQTYKNCQSCGIPLKKSPNGGGTNADKTISTIYCAYCYENGKFKQPNCTAEDMIAISKGKLKQMGFPSFIAGLMTMGIPKLKRWEE